MASKGKFTLSVGCSYFLELTDKLILTTRSEQHPVIAEDNNLIHVDVQPDYKLSEAVGYGMFFVDVAYPRGKPSVFTQRFPMVERPQQDIYEQRIVTALISIDLGATYVTFEIETVATF